MLSIGERIVQLRKSRGWSQEDLAKIISSSQIMISRYERNDNAPSIEVLCKLADAFQVNVDFIVGRGEYSVFDKDILIRMEAIQKLDSDVKKYLFFLIDNVVQNINAKKALLD